MKLAHVAEQLLLEPWLTTGRTHELLVDVFWKHVTGEAHYRDGVAALAAARAAEPEQDDGSWTLHDESGIAEITVRGVMAMRVSGLLRSCGFADTSDVAEMIRLAEESPEVRGVFLNIDSPGGQVSGIPELAMQIGAMRKPVVAFTDRQMASAAYWIGSQADEIFATPSSEVGSIGVYMALLDESRRQTMEGVRTEVFKSGRFKAMGLRGTELTSEQRQLLQSRVDQVFGWFVESVRASRPGVPQEATEGQSFYAADAQRMNLVDQIGTRQDALAELAALIRGGRK